MSQKTAPYHREARKALRACTQNAESFKFHFAPISRSGDRANVIVTPRELRGPIVWRPRARSMTRMRRTRPNKVLELPLPVEVIAGDAVSKAERYGIPVGIGTALAMLLFAAVD